MLDTPKQVYPTIEEQLEKIMVCTCDGSTQLGHLDGCPINKIPALKSLISRREALAYNEGYHKAKSEKKVKE